MAPFKCPTPEQTLGATLALLPRGRAWQTHETGPQPGYDIAFDPGGYEPPAFQTLGKASSVLFQFWKAVSQVYQFVNERLCALRMEFWCATHSETHAEWLTEYGLPNDCDPFPDLCIKVAAVGGINCEYYAMVAARSGWAITCTEVDARCGSRVGCGPRSMAGRMQPGRSRGGYLQIVVSLADSPAFVGRARQRPLAGRFLTGRSLACGPNLAALECVLARVIHAEILVTYEAK